jgi:hypothetical protein
LREFSTFVAPMFLLSRILFAGKADMRDDDPDLKRCHEEIRRLTAENQDLRRAAICFADLAERLNRQLYERDPAADRGGTSSDAPDAMPARCS